MKKIVISFFSIIIFLFIAFIGITIYTNHYYLPNTIINGINVSFKSYDQAYDLIKNKAEESYVLTINGRKETSATINGKDIGLTVTPDLSLAEQSNKTRFPLKNLFNENNIKVNTNVDYDEALLNKVISELPITQPESMYIPVNATIEYNLSSNVYQIRKEDPGTVIIYDELVKRIKRSISELKAECTLDDSCYQNPAIRHTNRDLVSRLGLLNTYIKSTVTYDFGNYTETIDYKIIHNWIDPSTGNFVDGVIDSYLDDLAKRTDTAYTIRTFNIGGKDIEVSGPYGYKIDKDKEREQLKLDILSGTDIKREPIYMTKGATRENELGSTFVEIDLTNQHVYLYSDGQLITDCDCVTGNLSKGYDTPEGIYPLTYKQRNAVLRGPGYASPVDYWMPFNKGIGLHDATWRSSFGGNIYKTNGSHGCVNLPHSAAKTIYEYAFTGMPVICHF